MNKSVLNVIQSYYDLGDEHMEIYAHMFKHYIANREASFKLEAVKNIYYDSIRAYNTSFSNHRYIYIANGTQYHKGYVLKNVVYHITPGSKNVTWYKSGYINSPNAIGTDEFEDPYETFAILPNDIILKRDILSDLRD